MEEQKLSQMLLEMGFNDDEILLSKNNVAHAWQQGNLQLILDWFESQQKRNLSNDDGSEIGSSSTLPALSAEEKSKKLDELRAKAAEKKRQQEKESMEAEKARKESQKAWLAAQRDLQDKQSRALKNEIEREKNEALLAKQRVLKQIEADKAERAALFKSSKKLEEVQSSSVSVKPLTFGTGQCRIQIKLPNGQILKNTFDSETTTIKMLFKWISDSTPELVINPNSRLCVPPCLSMSFDREEVLNQNLIQTGLCPAASLLFIQK